MVLLECKNLSIGYEKKVIQKGINFKIEKEDYLFILGENGTGKSTLIKTLLGFIRPLAGEIIVSKELKSSFIGYLPQTNAEQKDFPATVWEIVLSGCQGRLALRPFYSKKEKERALENLKKLGMDKYRKNSFRELSGGQQQRVLLARALCAADDFLLLDEPVKGFDPKITEEMYALIEELNKKGMTIVMISHDLNAAKKYAKHTLVLERDRSLEI